jgi:glycosyltransferase involved in cell wall biosynthesis
MLGNKEYKMRLLHIISSVDPKGGGPIEGIRQRGLFLQDLGHRVEVLSLDDPAKAHVGNFALPLHAIGPSRGTFAFNRRVGTWLRQNARNYDHIIIHGLWQHHGYAAARALQGMGLPYHVFTHGMLDPWFKHTYPLKHLKKWVYWLTAEYWVLRDARAVFFTSEEERLRARQSFWLYQAREHVVAYGTSPPPTDTQHYRTVFFDAHPTLAGKHLLLYLSRIHPKKGCDLLINAFAQVAQQQPAAHLLMAGPGDPLVLNQLKAQAARLGIAERITWLGMLSGDDKWAAFHAANVFVLPSHQENFGIAVAEALGCGRPVLISDKVNIWREIASDGAGLVESDTEPGTVSLLQRWFNLGPEQQAAMSQAASTSFAMRYTVAAMANGLVTALQSIPYPH